MLSVGTATDACRYRCVKFVDREHDSDAKANTQGAILACLSYSIRYVNKPSVCKLQRSKPQPSDVTASQSCIER